MRKWKYSADIKRVSVLIDETVKETHIACFGRDAKAVLRALEKARSPNTPMALNWLSTAALEVLEKRGANAKMLLLMARALADEALLGVFMRLFHQVFHANVCAECGGLLPDTDDPEQMLATLQAACNASGDPAAYLEGMPGVKMIKLKANQTAALTSDPTGN